MLSCLSSVRTPALACFTVTAANRAYVYRNSGRGKGGIKLKPRRLSHVAVASRARRGWASACGTYARTLIIVTIHTRTRLSTRPLNTCTTQLEDRASTSVGGNRGFRARMRQTREPHCATKNHAHVYLVSLVRRAAVAVPGLMGHDWSRNCTNVRNVCKNA